jgi:hypothetical protein
MVHDLSAWRSARKKAPQAAPHKEWSTLHFEEFFTILKSIEEGRGSVSVGTCEVTVSAGYGVEVVFHEDGSVFLGDGSCLVGERVHFISNTCFGLLEGPTLLRFLGLLLASVADGMGFVEWSAGHGVLYSDTYKCWAVFSSDGGVEFNRLFQVTS